MIKFKQLINNAESQDCPDFLKISSGQFNSVRKLQGEEKRHYVQKTWGISQECPTFFKFKDTVVNKSTYYNPFMNNKICKKNEKKAKF